VRWGLLVIGKSVQLVGHPALSLSLSQLKNSLQLVHSTTSGIGEMPNCSLQVFRVVEGGKS